jgi:hypothetical protein
MPKGIGIAMLLGEYAVETTRFGEFLAEIYLQIK